MDSIQNEIQIRKTSLCKCGKPARFIKDYFITEHKVLKEGDGDSVIKRNLENPCGILRRRYCQDCFSKIAARQRKINSLHNFKILFAVLLPFLVLVGLYSVSYFVLGNASAVSQIIVFGAIGIALTSLFFVLMSISQVKRRKISKGDFTDAKSIDALMDSLNFQIDEPEVIKDIPSIDVLVDGDGRANYEMERSGYNFKVLYKGKISLEGMRQRIRFPFKDDAEYIKRTYINAGFLDENIRSGEERELSEADFDIKNGELRRYSGLSVEIIIPAEVTKICAEAFKKTKNCEKIIIPTGVNEIEKEAFAFCPASQITIPQGIKKIPSFAFYSSGITELVLPEGVEEIEDNAFGECYSLEKVYVPSSCKRIGEAAFKNCNTLKEIILEEGLESLADYCFNGCTALERLEVPDGCYELGNFAFEGCKHLKEVYLPETIQFVGGRVFEGAKEMSIFGKSGSYAEKFAEQYRLRFTVTDAPRYKKQHRARKI
jgi:hypothetical protein